MGLRALLDDDVVDVAPRLLGMRLRSDIGARVVLRITEVEAYGGVGLDEASHAYRGMTLRNRSMFERAGHLYVYRSHGIHWCCNIVTGSSGAASAVLLRAGEITDGLEIARKRRPAAQRDRDLARGPGRLCAALGITGDHDGVDLLHPQSPLRLLPALRTHEPTIASGPRIGITRAVDQPWRWWVEDDLTVSPHRGSRTMG